MEGASMDALQERLLRLEALVYGASRGEPAAAQSSSVLPSETVLSRTHAIQQGLHRLEHTAPHLQDFYTKFRQLRRKADLQQQEHEGAEREADADGKQQQLGTDDLQERMASVAARAAIVCSYEEEARHVDRLTRTLNDHLPTLDNDRLKEVPIMMRELKPIEAVHWDQVEAASLLNDKFNELLNSYNDLMNLVSQQFLVWHERVSKWEQQLGIAQPTVVPPPPKKRGKATDAGKRPPKEVPSTSSAPTATTSTPTQETPAPTPTPESTEGEPQAQSTEASGETNGQEPSAPPSSATDQ